MRVYLGPSVAPQSRRSGDTFPRYSAPRLLVQWSSRREEFAGNLFAALAADRISEADLAGFAVPLRGGVMRPRSFGLAAAVHVAVVLLMIAAAVFNAPRPLTPEEKARLHAQKLTWYTFNDELPAIAPDKSRGAKTEAAKRPEPPRRGARGFSSQVIVSNPPQADNTRQTIFQPDTPNIRIERDVPVPNIVMMARQAPRPALDYLPAPSVQLVPSRRAPLQYDAARPVLQHLPAPDVQVTQQARALPLDVKRPELAHLPAPDVRVTEQARNLPLNVQRPELAHLPAPSVPVSQPRLPLASLPAGEVTQPAPPPGVVRREVADLRAPGFGAPRVGRPAPEVPAPPPQIATGGPGGAAGGGASRTLVALGVNPSPPSGPISVPAGNRAGTFSTGPNGDTASAAGDPAAEGTNGGGLGSGTGVRDVADLRVPGISITGGVRPPSAAMGPVVSGPAPPRNPAPLPEPPRARPSAAERERLASIIARESRPTLPEWGRRGAMPKDDPFLPGKRVYTVYINLPNVSSQSGSWVLRFAELADRNLKDGTDLTAPVARRKVDPGYHPDAMREGVHGMVTLYGVIGADGKVSRVKVVRGLDPRLDERAIRALQGWEFLPAKRNGVAVDTEAIVQIPFTLNGIKTGF